MNGIIKNKRTGIKIILDIIAIILSGIVANFIVFNKLGCDNV